MVISVDNVVSWMQLVISGIIPPPQEDEAEQQRRRHIRAKLGFRRNRKQLERKQKEITYLHASYRNTIDNLKKELDSVADGRTAAENAYHDLKRMIRTVQQESAAKDKLLSDMQQQVTALTRQLESTQFRPSDPLYDDQASKAMKRLNQQLNKWVSVNFPPSPQLDELTVESFTGDPFFSGEISEPETFHERRLLVHAVVARSLSIYIFDSFMLGTRTRSSEVEAWMKELADNIHHHCSPDILKTWLGVTSCAVRNISQGALDDTCNPVLEKAAESLQGYSTADPEKFNKQLKKLVMNCIKMKQQLERQGSYYFFERSPPGTPYNSDTMQTFMDEQNTEAIVKYSLWPGLWRHTPDGRHMIEPEEVWTRARLQIQQAEDDQEEEDDDPWNIDDTDTDVTHNTNDTHDTYNTDDTDDMDIDLL